MKTTVNENVGLLQLAPVDKTPLLQDPICRQVIGKHWHEHEGLSNDLMADALCICLRVKMWLQYLCKRFQRLLVKTVRGRKLKPRRLTGLGS